MNWKEKLNIGDHIFDENTDKYLMDNGFEIGKMNARNGYDDSDGPDIPVKKIQGFGEPCFTISKKINGKYIYIYINKTESFLEIEDSLGSYIGANYLSLTEDMTIDDALNEILEII